MCFRCTIDDYSTVSHVIERAKASHIPRGTSVISSVCDDTCTRFLVSAQFDSCRDKIADSGFVMLTPLQMFRAT